MLERADLSGRWCARRRTVLVILLLVHSGRAGLPDMLGGGMGASAAGSTVMERNLERITVVLAVLFSFPTVILALRPQ